MKILNESSFLKDASIKIIENKMNATYVFESCLKNKYGGWVNFPVAVFYTEQAHPQGSNWFGFYISDQGDSMITDAISAIEDFSGIQIDDEVIYSRYRHDYRTHKGIFVDGGRDYLRFGGERIADAKQVRLHVVRDKIELV
jgi:hypothetical protein